MIDKIKDVNDLDTATYLGLLIHYLGILQDGRTKPNTKGEGYIRESLYNLEEIDEVKDRINDILRIHKKPVSVEFRDATTKRTYKY